MKTTLFAAAFCLLLVSFSFAQSDEINIIPKPQSVASKSGSFSVNRETIIATEDKIDRKIADLLNDYLAAEFGFKLKVVKGTYRARTEANRIIISNVGGDIVMNNGAYRLKVSPERVKIEAYSASGRYYGLQSFIQLHTKSGTSSATFEATEIDDFPRFQYRGMHLDVSRHFMPVEFVKKYIDLMSQYKFNTFHWHLTDDQGWRIEIKKYPRLTEVGSKRPESHFGPYTTTFKGDGVPVEGFYTQDQIRDVVAYAKARYITVIPEIELPGHASAALAAYPQYGCRADHKYNVQKTWGIFNEVFCPTDETFKFLEDVLDETIKLFPDSPYIHIGGDEVLKTMWKESAFVQELKRREGLKDEHEVQSYFVRRIEKFINSKGKKIIGWDEILEGGLAPNATVMSWRGMKGGIEAAKAKHDVIMTPTDYSYFDYGQGDPMYEPLFIGGYLPLEKVYSFDPVPKELDETQAKYIIGGQANIWTEYLETPAAVEYMAFPRMLAMAESLWSTPGNKNFDDFKRRLDAQFPRLDSRQVNYRIPEPAGLRNMIVAGDGKATIDLKPAIGTKVYYTLDGTTPDERSRVYDKPFVVELKQDETVELKTVVANSVGRKSVVYVATLVRKEMMQAVEPQSKMTGKTPGVNYSLYVPSNAYAQDTPPQKGESRSIDLQQFAQRIDPTKTFGVTFEGYINIAVDGIYNFQIDSTNDRQLTIDGQTLIDEAGTKERAIKSVVVPLKAGWHKIAMHYDHREGEMFFRVRYGLKGQGLTRIGGGELVH